MIEGSLHDVFHSDIDECEENLGNCGDNAVCVNTIGSFMCQCLPGFSGNGLICIGKLSVF